jgi:hypothetical protein
MRYFLDTEFMEDGKAIELLSLALVSEDDRKLYIINYSADWGKANAWVQENILPQLNYDLTTKEGIVFPHREIKARVLQIIGEDPKPEFWGYYADYDWVVFCQLFGAMVNLPRGFPMYCRDLKQLCDHLGIPRLLDVEREHHALHDAEWIKGAFSFLQEMAGRLHPGSYDL